MAETAAVGESNVEIAPVDKPIDHDSKDSSNNKRRGRRAKNNSSNNGSNYNNRDRRDRSRSRSPHERHRKSRSSESSRRVYVANIPFEVGWSDVKDLFREKIGNVLYCQLFEDDQGRPRGCGLVEFDNAASAKRACEVLHRFDWKDRQLVVKEDFEMERDSCGRLLLTRADRERDRSRDDRSRRDRSRGGRERSRDRYAGNDHDRHRSSSSSRGFDRGHDRRSGRQPGWGSYETYGLNVDFLNSLGIRGPLNNRVFVANLDFKVDERKLEDVFRLAGKIERTKLYTDHAGKSKGMAVIEFEHPVEAVQAISMFNNQKLYDRVIGVRLDKFEDSDSFGSERWSSKLPPGLENIGKGLGINGQPLNIAQISIDSNPATGSTGGGVAAAVVPAAAHASPVVPPTAVLPAVLNTLASVPNLVQSLAQFSQQQAVAPSSSTTSGLVSGGYMSHDNNLPQSSHYGSYSSGPGYSSTSSMYGGGGGGGAAAVVVNTPPSYPSTAVPSYQSTYDSRYTSPPGLDSSSSYNVRNSLPPPPSPSSASNIDTVFIRNLSPNLSYHELQDRFGKVGEVASIELKGHGTALVRYARPSDAQRAIHLINGTRIDNRVIEVNLYY